MELEVRERIVHTNVENDEVLPTGHSLFSGGNKQSRQYSQQTFARRCVFCDNRNHKPQDCKLVTRPQARKRILMSKHCCYICMKQGDLAKDCKSSIKCFVCGNRHHI